MKTKIVLPVPSSDVYPAGIDGKEKYYDKRRY